MLVLKPAGESLHAAGLEHVADLPVFLVLQQLEGEDTGQQLSLVLQVLRPQHGPRTGVQHLEPVPTTMGNTPYTHHTHTSDSHTPTQVTNISILTKLCDTKSQTRDCVVVVLQRSLELPVFDHSVILSVIVG